MRSLLTLLWWAVATPIAFAFAVPWTLITRDVRFLYWTGIRIAAVGVRLAGVRVQTEGLDRLDPGATYMYMSNHVSNLDPPVLIPALPHRTSVLVKKELFRIPVLGQAMRIASLVPVDRRNREAAIASLKAAASVIRQGISMTIFVEGTRSRDGRLLPFKKGPFYLAADTRVPVVPVTILGTYELLPKGKTFARPGTVRVIFHPPLDPAAYADNDCLMATVRERIASALPCERR